MVSKAVIEGAFFVLTKADVNGYSDPRQAREYVERRFQLIVEAGERGLVQQAFTRLAITNTLNFNHRILHCANVPLHDDPGKSLT